MLWGRKIARCLNKYSWYNPHGQRRAEHEEAAIAASLELDGKESPSLDLAWAHFEHCTLPRHLVGSSKGNYTKARYSEDEYLTRFFPIWGTPESNLSCFGEGVSLYFFTLRSLAFILFLAGLINIPFISYYTSDEYNHNKRGMVPLILRGTAVCTDTTWTACPSCRKSQWDHFPRAFNRYGETADGSLRFIMVNHCKISYLDGFLSFLSLLLVFFGIGYFSFHVLKKREIQLDESVQTTADYTVKVENPPKDARDAKEWGTFFSQFGHVTCCTVALDNGELVRALLKKRNLIENLSQLLPPGVMFNKHNIEEAVKNAMPLKLWQNIIYNDAETIKQQISHIDEEIHGMSDKVYSACRVFVTFEKESSQHKALTDLSVPRWITLSNKSSALRKALCFRGNRVLRVRRPPEPLAVRWAHFGTSLKVSIYPREKQLAT